MHLTHLKYKGESINILVLEWTGEELFGIDIHELKITEMQPLIKRHIKFIHENGLNKNDHEIRTKLIKMGKWDLYLSVIKHGDKCLKSFETKDLSEDIR